jgi:cytochrome c-type biogenesis protein CcmH/NrfF
MFWIFVIILLIISFVWALLSYKRERKTPKQILKAKRELAKSKILFKK